MFIFLSNAYQLNPGEVLYQAGSNLFSLKHNDLEFSKLP